MNKASISIFGLGYVGSVTSACFASKGYKIVGVDPNPQKVTALQQGASPILEPGLEEIVKKAHAEGLLTATADSAAAIAQTSISFISVGTPSQRNGKLDLSHVVKVCREIGLALAKKSEFHWIVLRSTVLPGTTEQVVIPELERASGKRQGVDFGVCFNPEFLREGSAIHDFFDPPYTVLGTSETAKIETIRELYAWAPTQIYVTSPKSAEMVKYVCNAFHALKVAFANEVGTLCSEMDVDKHVVTDIYTSDTRLNISKAYLKPGFAFGGSCLPKDLRAITYKAKELDLKLPLMENIMPSNTEHIERAASAVLASEGRRVGVLGLSFKPGTDDLRESPMVHLVKRLLGEGCEIKIWDNNVALGQLIGSNRDFIQEYIPHIGSLLCSDQREVIEHADVIVLGTNAVDKKKLIENLRSDQSMIDLVHLDYSHLHAARAATTV